MVYRSNIEQPSQPHNVRRTRNKPRRMGVTNAEYQRSRPDIEDAVARQREELRILLEKFTGPQETSDNTDGSGRQENTGSSCDTENQEPEPATSGAEKMDVDPQPGTSSSTGSGGSSNVSLVCALHLYSYNKKSIINHYCVIL